MSTPDPAKVEHLAAKLREAGTRGSVDWKTIATELLDNGVDVTLPAQPSYPVGTTGTATVRGVEGVRVMRIEGDGVWEWKSATPAPVWDIHEGGHVYDFVPDVLLTPERVEELCDAFHKRFAWIAGGSHCTTSEINGWFRLWAADQGGAR